MAKIIFTVPFLAILLFAPVSGKATEIERWEEAYSLYEQIIKSKNLSSSQMCNQIWEILWSWAKRGNLEARAELFMLSFQYWPKLPQIIMPGRVGDEISTYRDATILGVHSIGVSYKDNGKQKKYTDHLDMLYELFEKGVRGPGFLECLKTETPEYCARSAQKPGAVTGVKFVPTFEEYAREIDSLVAQNFKPECKYFNDNFYNK